MNKTIIFGIVVFVVGLAILVIRGERTSQSETKPLESISKASENTNKYKTQTNSEGQVTVEVTPINLSSDKVQFKISFNTHDVSLDKNLKEISILIDDKGREYKPISWDGGAGGHHIEGTLVFSPLSKDTKSIKLTMKGIGGVDRSFAWSL